MVNIFREVDEDIRKERYIHLFRKYGVYGIIIIFIVVGSLAAIQFYSSYKISSNEKIFAEYINIVESFPNDAINQLSELDESNNFLNGMKLLKQSEILVLENNEEQASALLETMIENKELNNIHREIAIYKILMINFDQFDLEKISYYQAKVGSKSDIFFLIEELVGIKLLIDGNKTLAIKKLESLSTSLDAPNEIKNRSLVLLKIAE